ncbi:hypothetical protein BJF93_11890 [Xaviernesmea oryzae]|uniref:DUF2076 domain-containing protein n=1 Tax=Xaviernesmea oryzae TaxID=464029 RepID=A0A1Q9AVC7_9HYPH|nr:DUF2076 domain-containing protein [Xaviernesmea oryzae]OLP59416.1 hypothetical protein BJF93_11890 [Xaviernesmea oryzae]SEL60908.1 hypothetical protein SAMN04487976_11090 [Xaviernesmea oryzae]
MSPDEKQLLTALFDRVKAASNTPRDREAEALIEQAVRAQPSATYYLAQAVIIQEKGLEAASARIEELEARLRDLEANRTRAPEQGGGFLSSIFGSNDRPQPAREDARPQAAPGGPWGPRPSNYGAPPPQAPAYGGQQGYGSPPPAYGGNPGPWGGAPQQPSAGGGFIRGALGTAAGVAGGMLLANSLSGLFGSHMAQQGLTAPGETLAGSPIEETTIVNNYYGDDAITEASDPGNAGDGGWGQDDGGFQQADADPGDSFGGDDFGGFGDDSSNV